MRRCKRNQNSPMKNQKENSVSFTGYRTSKILKTSPLPNLLEHVQNDVYLTISKLYQKGYNTFISGMSEGFDLLAAQAVLEFKQNRLDIHLIAVIPFNGQELRYSDEDKATYKYVCDNADSVVFTSHYYSKDAFFKRNDYLLDNCGMVVCYYDGESGGTMYTYNRAKKRGLPIINIFDRYSEKSPLDK